MQKLENYFPKSEFCLHFFNFFKKCNNDPERWMYHYEITYYARTREKNVRMSKNRGEKNNLYRSVIMRRRIPSFAIIGLYTILSRIARTENYIHRRAYQPAHRREIIINIRAWRTLHRYGFYVECNAPRMRENNTLWSKISANVSFFEVKLHIYRFDYCKVADNDNC